MAPCVRSLRDVDSRRPDQDSPLLDLPVEILTSILAIACRSCKPAATQESDQQSLPEEESRDIKRLEHVCQDFKRLVQYAHFSENEFRTVFGRGILWKEDVTADGCCHFSDCDFHYDNVRHLTVVPLIYDEKDFKTCTKVSALVLKCRSITRLTVDVVGVHEDMASKVRSEMEVLAAVASKARARHVKICFIGSPRDRPLLPVKLPRIPAAQTWLHTPALPYERDAPGGAVMVRWDR